MTRTLIAALFTLASGAASASLISSSTLVEVTLKIDKFANGNAAVNVTLDSWGTIGAGQLQGTLNGTSFLTYCVDLSQTFAWGKTYTYTYDLQSSGFSQTQANLLGKLYTSYGSAAAASTTDASVAFQLATWEILYETGSFGSITGGAFNLISGATTAQRNLTNNWLTDIARLDAPQSFTAQRLYSSIAQDFLLFNRLLPPPPQLRIAVPEPASYALVGIALAGLGLSRRRKR